MWTRAQPRKGGDLPSWLLLPLLVLVLAQHGSGAGGKGAQGRTSAKDATPEQQRHSRQDAAAERLTAGDVGAEVRIGREYAGDDGLATFTFKHRHRLDPQEAYTSPMVERLFGQQIFALGRDPLKLFQALDKDSDGHLRGQEIHALDGVFRAAEEAAKAKQAQARGGLDLETFAGRYKLWLKGGEQGVAAEPSKILAAFQALDSDGNKKLSDDEMEEVGSQLDMVLVRAGNQAVAQMRERERELHPEMQTVGGEASAAAHDDL